jgi:hypothetical protein
MSPVDDYCKVTTRGVAHLFLGLDYGSVCVCGRKVFAFAVEDEQPILRDRTQDETASLLTAVRRQTPSTPRPVRLNLLLARGDAVIHRARQAREQDHITRAKQSLARAEALLARARFLIQSALQVRAASARARARRESASGRRLVGRGATPDLYQGLLPRSEEALVKA